jgi:hypothetical protein
MVKPVDGHTASWILLIGGRKDAIYPFCFRETGTRLLLTKEGYRGRNLDHKIHMPDVRRLQKVQEIFGRKKQVETAANISLSA